MEIYEGIAFVRTRDPDKGLVEFWISPSFQNDFRDIITAIQQEVSIKIIEEDK
jgi:hypothetical protein